MEPCIDLALLAQTKRIVFFDIDSTLTSSVDHCLLNYQPMQLRFKQSLFDPTWRTIRFADFLELSPSCLALFARLLEQTGAKAVCIASWGIRNDQVRFNRELKAAFERFCVFPDDWLLGSAGSTGGDRYQHTILPFLQQTPFQGEHITLDDSAFEYSDQTRAIAIHGETGFVLSDYEQSLRLFGIDDAPNLEPAYDPQITHDILMATQKQ